MPKKEDTFEIEQGASYLFAGPYAPYQDEFEGKVIGYDPATGLIHVALQREGSHARINFQLGGGGGWKVLGRTSGDHSADTGGVDDSAKTAPPR